MELRTVGLAAAVGGRIIVSGVDLTCASGSVTAVVGTNGSGKSTLLRALSGIRRPAAGHVEIDGQRLDRLPARTRALSIALVAQEEEPPDDLLVGEMIALGRTPHTRPWEVGGRDERRIVLDALDRVGLAHAVDRSCDQLSGGERRRALLARGLVQEAPILVLDEPTNHLDVSYQHQLLRLVRELGRTVLLALHDLDLALHYADQVVVLHDGAVLAAGAPTDVLTRADVADAFGVRMARLTDPVTGLDHIVPVPAFTPASPPAEAS